MKKFIKTCLSPITYHLIPNINRAYQDLRKWCDPAFEDHPYILDYKNKSKTETRKTVFVGKRFFSFR